MDTGYTFKTGKETHRFLQQIFELDVEGVNFFIDELKDPCGVVILRFRGQADISKIDAVASKLGGGRMYLPRDWRIVFSDYELTSIECFD